MLGNKWCLPYKRSGKSYSAIKLAEKIQKGFDVDKQLFFKPKDFVVFMQNNTNSVAILDEASMYMSNREWYETSNRILNQIFTTQGFRKNVIIMTLPVLNHLDKRQISLCHLLMVTIGSHAGTIKCYRIKSSQFSSKIFPLGFEILKFDMPSKENIEKYEIIKKKYNDKLLEQNMDYFKALDEAQQYVRSFSSRDYLRAFREGLMKKDEIINRLEKMGFHRDDIEIMVNVEAVKKQPSQTLE